MRARDIDVLNVGRFGPPRAAPSAFVTPADTAAKDALQPGNLIEWKGVRFEWTSRHVHASELEQWRACGDEVADAALAAAQRIQHSQESNTAAPSTSGSNGGCPAAASRDAYAAVATAGAAGDAAAAAFLAEVTAVPAWVQWDRIAEGQQFFLRNLAGAGSALLFVSLVGGFGAPRINKVLSSTGYLTSVSKASYLRIIETVQMVSDCMEAGGMEVGGCGWAAVLRVRLLHSAVRVRLSQQPKWDTAAWGVPINQEDLLVTQLAFSQLVLVSLERIGVRATLHDMESYLHLWRWIGHLMGVQARLGDLLGDLPSAEAALESIMLHLVEPDASSSLIAANVLESVAVHSPTKYTVEHMASMTRRLVGETYADALGIPPGETALLKRLGVEARLLTFRLSSFLAALPLLGPRLTRFMHWALKSLMLKTLDGKRTNFALKRSPSDLNRATLERQASLRSSPSRSCPMATVSPPQRVVEERVSIRGTLGPGAALAWLFGF